jgi:tryptophan halogenase
MPKGKNIVVVGGGTAGWLTALLCKKIQKDSSVTLIESEEVGILGAGEGSVPDLVNVLSILDISLVDTIKNSDATIKLGIDFVNWHGDNTSYFHGFRGPSLNPDMVKAFYFDFASRGFPVEKCDLLYKLSSQKKVNFFRNEKNGQIEYDGSFGLHFNARKFAKFLRSVGEKRGILRTEGLVNEIFDDSETGNVKKIKLQDGQLIDGDFFFDCTGFARLIIGKHFKSEWISYNNSLPLDTALPFFIPHDNTDIKPVTEAIAMKYGWVWKIPVKDRYGCGYVFDSSYINEEQAKKELEEYFKIPIESPKTFRFKAGCYKDIWIKNVMAVGLSSGFIEPLEATSIWVNSINLSAFLLNNLFDCDNKKIREYFNDQTVQRNMIIKEFIHLHYLGQRSDSGFWKDFREKHPPSEFLNDRMQFAQTIGINWNNDIFDGANTTCLNALFTSKSWFQVMDGLRMTNRKTYKKLTDIYSLSDNSLHEEFGFQSNFLKKCMDCGDFIKSL